MSDAFRTELASLVPRLRRFAYALTGTKDDGDDVVQAACIKALERWDQFQPGTRLDSWVFRIIQTAWIDRVRWNQRRGPVVDPDDLPESSDEGIGARRAEGRLALDRVRAAMARLPEEQRAVLALVAIEGLSYAETAKVLSIPAGTVMSRLARARGRLADLLGETQ